jgi:hypothetical protein
MSDMFMVCIVCVVCSRMAQMMHGAKVIERAGVRGESQASSPSHTICDAANMDILEQMEC